MSALWKALGHVVVLILIIAALAWLFDRRINGDAVILAIGFSALVRTYERVAA